jgi:hypothetical protein
MNELPALDASSSLLRVLENEQTVHQQTQLCLEAEIRNSKDVGSQQELTQFYPFTPVHWLRKKGQNDDMLMSSASEHLIR